MKSLNLNEGWNGVVAMEGWGGFQWVTQVNRHNFQEKVTVSGYKQEP